MGSLAYQEANERRNQVENAHDGTFEWIFQHDGENEKNEHRRWNDIAAFIRSPEDKLYWISGKPGSGKSTLMKFLLNDARIKEMLGQASPTGSCVTASHFIWTSGTSVQRSLRGALASLLFQLLGQSEEAFGYLSSQVPSLNQRRSLSDWSNEDLVHAIHLVTSNYSGMVYLYLDGLDEVASTDTRKMLDFIDRICKTPNVKCITSSRPEHIFSTHFSKRQVPTLRMQDLTMPDIERYARDSLREYFNDLQALRGVVQRLCDKAEGVFLWVALAVRSQQLGALNMDDPEELARRLDQLPKGLSELYSDMWDRLNESKEIYGEQGAKYLNLMVLSTRLVDHRMDPWVMLFATRPELRYKSFQSADPSFLGDVEDAQEKLIIWITVRSAGLIELNVDTWHSNFVFVHRSALEFLENTPKGLEIRGLDKSLPEDSVLSLMEAMLASSKHGSDADRLDSMIAQIHSRTNRIPKLYEICRHNFSLLHFLNTAARFFEDGHVSYVNYMNLLAHAESTYSACLLLAESYPRRVCRGLTSTISGDFLGFLTIIGCPEYVAVKFEQYSSVSKISPEYLEYIKTETCYSQTQKSGRNELDRARQSERLKRSREWLSRSYPGPWYSHPSSMFGGRQRTATGLVCTRLLKSLSEWIAYTEYAFEPAIFHDIIQSLPSDHRALYGIACWRPSAGELVRGGWSLNNHVFIDSGLMLVYLEISVQVLIKLHRIMSVQPASPAEECRQLLLTVLEEEKGKESSLALFIQTWERPPTLGKGAKIFPEQFFRLKTKEDREYVTEAAMLCFVQGNSSGDEEALANFAETRLEENGFDKTSIADFDSVLVERGHGYYPGPQNPWPPVVSEDLRQQSSETAEADWHRDIGEDLAKKERDREYILRSGGQIRGVFDGEGFVITSVTATRQAF